MKEFRWLITGGCGFIGVALTDHIRRESPGAHIRVLDDLSIGKAEDLKGVSEYRETDGSGPPSGVELVIGDVREQNTCLRCVEGVDVVVHLAASTGVSPSIEDPRLDKQNNVDGVFNMLEAARARGVRRFIFASSSSPVALAPSPVREDMAPRPASPYGASKLAGEGYCMAYHESFGLDSVVLRFSNVYGPFSRRNRSVVADFFRRALKGEPLEIYGDGIQRRDFLYVEDAVRAILASASADVGGEVINIGSSKETTILELARMIGNTVSEKTGREVEITNLKSRAGDVERNSLEISKARQLLGWSPEVDMVTGLGLTFEYFNNL